MTTDREQFLLYFTGRTVYNIFFHPLRKYPGPLLCAVTRWPSHIAKLSGNIQWSKMLHDKYGMVVRIGPNELSYIEAQAWKDIHGFPSGNRGNFEKDLTFYGPDAAGHGGLFRADDTSHARQRRIFSHAFSDRALKQEEPMMHQYVEKLVSGLRNQVQSCPSAKVDLVEWYNFTTFDVMADLTFGESLHMLDEGAYAPWVEAAFGFLSLIQLGSILRYYPMLAFFFTLFIPAETKRRSAEHKQNSIDKVNRRLAKKIDRIDIWSLIMKQEGEKALSLSEMYANATTFMAAGTETTATLMSGLTYLLLNNPDKHKRLVDEIRGSFTSDQEMNLTTLARLPYLAACLEEGLRMYPPVPWGNPRLTPATGGIVCGEYLPPKTNVIIPHLAAYHSSRNFKDPMSFRPERWLGDADFASDNKGVMQPFSFGPRNCLGKNLAYHEMRSVVANLLWHFDLTLCEESHDWKNQRAYVVWEKPPLLVNMTPVKREGH